MFSEESLIWLVILIFAVMLIPIFALGGSTYLYKVMGKPIPKEKKVRRFLRRYTLFLVLTLVLVVLIYAGITSVTIRSVYLLVVLVFISIILWISMYLLLLNRGKKHPKLRATEIVMVVLAVVIYLYFDFYFRDVPNWDLPEWYQWMTTIVIALVVLPIGIELSIWSDR